MSNKLKQIFSAALAVTVVMSITAFSVNAEKFTYTWDDIYASDFNTVTGLPITGTKTVEIAKGITAYVESQWNGATGTSKIESVLHTGSETDSYIKMTQQGSGYVPRLKATGDAIALDDTASVNISFDFMPTEGGTGVRFGIDDDGLTSNKYYMHNIVGSDGAPVFNNNNMAGYSSSGGYFFYYENLTNKVYMNASCGDAAGIVLTDNNWYRINIQLKMADEEQSNAQTVKLTVTDISGDTPVVKGTYKGILDANATGTFENWAYDATGDTVDDKIQSINGVAFTSAYQSTEWSYGIDNLSVDVTKDVSVEEIYSDSEVVYTDLDMDINKPSATFAEYDGKGDYTNKTENGLTSGEYSLSTDAPGEEGNKAFKYAVSAETAADYPVMGNVAASNSKYSAKGLKANKTTFATARMHLTSADLATLKADSTKYFEFGLGVEASNIYVTNSNIKITADADGENFNVGGVKIAPDTWFTIDWKYKLHTSVSGDANVNKMAVTITTADGVTSTPVFTRVHGTDVGWGNWVTVGEGTISALQIRTPQATVVNGIYVDDLKIWQIKNDIGVEAISLDPDAGKLTLKYNTRMAKTEAEKAVLKLGNTVLTNVLSNAAVQQDPHIVVYDVDMERLAFSTAYTIELPANTVDENGQVAYDVISVPYTTPTSFTISVLGAPVITNAGTAKPDVDFTLQNISNREGTVWAVVAAYDDENMMLDSASDNIFVDANGTTLVNNLEFTKDCSDADSIRLYVWETKASLKTVQRSVEVWHR